MLDLKAHVLHELCRADPDPDLPCDHRHHHGSFNAAVAIAGPCRRGWALHSRRACCHLATILGSGVIVGALLAFSTMIVTRWGRPWFTISLGIVVGDGLLRRCAARLIGGKPAQSRRTSRPYQRRGDSWAPPYDTPPYLLGRLAS